MSNSMKNVNARVIFKRFVDCIWNRIPFVENLWKIVTIYFQARSASRHSEIRENVANLKQLTQLT